MELSKQIQIYEFLNLNLNLEFKIAIFLEYKKNQGKLSKNSNICFSNIFKINSIIPSHFF